MHYIVQAGDSLAKIARRHSMSLTRLLALNPIYKANPNQIRIGDEIVTALDPAPADDTSENSQTGTAEPARSAGAPDTDSEFVVTRGQLTFDAEGMESPGGRYHSRVLHVPGSTSGATIGRGYDMKLRSSIEIREDLIVAGVSELDAKSLSRLAGRQGSGAESFIAAQGLDHFEITPAQQKALFEMVYAELESDVIRICEKADVVARYGTTDWQNLAPTLKDVVIDLRFRGDYFPATRQKIQSHIASNNLDVFSQKLSEKNYWVDRINVPLDRFNRRNQYLE